MNVIGVVTLIEGLLPQYQQDLGGGGERGGGGGGRESQEEITSAITEQVISHISG